MMVRPLAFCIVVTSAVAAGWLEPTPAEAQARRGKSATEVVITNARAAAVNGLSITNAEGASVGGIAQPIASGGRVRVKLQKGAGCVLTIEASFDDETVSGPDQVDACADKNIRFRD